MRKLKTVIVVASIAAAIAAMSTANANAGTYNVKQCDPASGAGLDSAWRNWNNTSGWQLFNGCSSGFGVSAAWAAGGDAGWYTALPGGLYIDAVSYSASAGNNDIGTYAMLCYTGGSPTCGYAVRSVNLSQHVGQTTVNDLLVCNDCTGFQVASMRGGSIANGWYSMYNMTFTMDDHVLPSVWNVGGQTTLDSSGGWNRGTKKLEFGAWDGSSGIKSAYSVIDGQSGNPANATDTKSCDYRYFSPCPANSGAVLSVPTTVITDGTHTVQARANDAGDNIGSAPTLTFKVDNTPPAAPVAVTPAAETAAGWQSANDFDLSWTNTGETAETATRSGIARACYDVDPGEGQATNPAEVCVDGALNKLDNIAVPADGTWSVDLSTIDKAGNQSAKTTRLLKLDRTTPGKPTGVANGWIGLDELLQSKKQKWSHPLPVSIGKSDLCGYGFSVTAGQFDDAPTAINYIGKPTEAPIPSDTPEGISYAHFRAISCAGLAGLTETMPVKVDLTNPQSSVSGVPAAGWTNAPGNITTAGTDAMPGSGLDGAIPEDPDVTHGGSVRFDVDGTTAEEHRGGATGSYDASSLAEGTHTLTVTTFDVARNRDEQVFNFGIDKTPPGGAFIGADPEDPTVFKVAATDALSGAAGGEIEYAPIDASGNVGSFKTLATTYDAGLLSASFPDTKLPSGSYALRGRVVDAATNVGYATKDARGHDMVITTPLRTRAGLTLTASRAGKLCAKRQAKTKTGRKRALRQYKKCVKRLRAEGGTDVEVKVAYGRKSVLYGQLANDAGYPIANQKIEIYQQRTGAAIKLVGGATTDSQGRFDYLALAGPSRRIVAYWPGNKKQQDVSASARLAVLSKVSLRVSPRVVHGSKKFTLSGKVFAQEDVSAAGKLVQLQFYNFLRKKWQAGPALVRANANGKFAYSYRVRRTAAARERIRFRAFVPGESSWAYDPGVSSARSITVYKR